MRKLSLIAAAVLVAFAFHAAPAYAAEAAEAVEAAGEEGRGAAPGGFACPCFSDGRGPGPRGMMWRNWRGGRPGPQFMRQGGWRDRDGDDSRRGRGFGRGEGRGFERERFGRGGRDERGERGGRFGGMFGSGFMEKLELTAEQRTKMIDVATENFRERLTLRWEMEEARKTLRTLSESDAPDYEAIIAANAALGSARGRLDVARRKVADRFAAVLTPEQREKVGQFRAGGDDASGDEE